MHFGSAVRQRAAAALLVFVSALILPLVGTARDMAPLIWLYITVLGLEAAVAPIPAGLASLAIAPLGLGTLLALALYGGMRAMAAAFAPPQWPFTLLLGAVSVAFLVDLALVVLGLERSSLWLAPGAAVGMALATANALTENDSKAQSDDIDGSTRLRGARSVMELALACVLALFLALFGALLTHKPALRQLATAGGCATVPLLALALLRVAERALEHESNLSIDRLGILLIVLWALAVTWLMEI